MSDMAKTAIITAPRRRIFEADADTINFWRRNPIIACRDLLGIELTDYQKYQLQNLWTASHSVLCCGRNTGKSFVGGIFLILWALLFPDQNEYIISSVGDQAKVTFNVIEEIILGIGRTAASIVSLKDIAKGEVRTSVANKTGFSHNPTGYMVEFYNGSKIFTLNSKPSNARSRRANVVFYDEAAFCSGELIAATEPFTTQDSGFKTSTTSGYNPKLVPKQPPNKLIYASSQDGMDTVFYRYYKQFAKRMIAGDRNYFVCDFTCEVAMKPYVNGVEYAPLLSREKVDTAMKADKDKALREYYNVPSRDGGVNQIVKWGTIRTNETFYLPTLSYRKENDKIVMAFDPARSSDNSIVAVMRIYEDPVAGYCGDIINCINFVDSATRGKYKLDSNRQLAGLRELLVRYNGTVNDYENIVYLCIDAGAGGGGVSAYADQLLNSWTDERGIKHRGLIDMTSDYYSTYVDDYPEAVDKLRLISPKKYRTQMVEEFIELMKLGVLRFPHEYTGQDTIRVPSGIDKASGDEMYDLYDLSPDEQVALMQIDLMKREITSIDKTTNPDNTSVTYALSKNLENTANDDRFYCAILLAHQLYDMRRGVIIGAANPDEWADTPVDVGKHRNIMAGGCVSPLAL